MRKSIILVLVILIFTLSACDSHQEVVRENLVSTDLSAVMIDGISVGNAIDTVDMTKYTELPPDTFIQKENLYYFQELRMETDEEGNIQEVRGNIYAYVEEYEAVPFSVNGKENLSSINEVVDLLGKNHNHYWFDREQGIYAYTFYDSSNKVYATFAYIYNSNELVWVILSE